MTATLVHFDGTDYNGATTELAGMGFTATDKAIFWKNGSEVVVVRVRT